MPKIIKTVFISYRRQDIAWAELIFQSLRSRGFDVFVDIHELRSGDFERVILANIKSRAHFLVLLTPTALERCTNPEDLFRREIETAIHKRKNIIPIMLSGFSFGGPGVAEQLGASLAQLAHYNGLPVPGEYFESAMERLRDFLEVPLEEVEHPTLAPPSELPLDPIVCLVARISMMTMLPISIAPNSTVYILPLSNKTPTMGFMEIGNGAGEFSQWPSPGQMNGVPREFALGCTLSNAIEKALVNVRLVFQVHYRLPRPDGGVVVADPIEHSSYPRATAAMIHPYKTFSLCDCKPKPDPRCRGIVVHSSGNPDRRRERAQKNTENQTGSLDYRYARVKRSQSDPHLLVTINS